MNEINKEFLNDLKEKQKQMLSDFHYQSDVLKSKQSRIDEITEAIKEMEKLENDQ